MNRREFLRKAMPGAALVPISLSLPAAAAVTSETAIPAIDPDRLARTAYEHFIPGKLTCCESIMAAGCAELGIKSDLIPDVALGLAGGIGLQGDTCGVLTGAALVLSLAVAQKQKEYPKKKMTTFQAVGRLYREFERRVGTTQCRKLSGLDLTTAQDRKKLEETVKAATCTKFLQVGSQLLAMELQKL